MIVGHCSFCGGVVRIPINVDVETSVRCPHCSETTQLGTILEAAVPQLEIVGSESDSAAPEVDPPYEIRTDLESSREKGTKFEVSPVLSKGAKRPKNRRGDRKKKKDRDGTAPRGTSANKMDGGPLVLEGTTEPPTAGVRNQAASRRSSRSKRNTFKKPRDFEMVKIVVGALLAFPVAQLLIWWLVGADPLNMGPTVSQYAPAVVPNKFHHKFNSGSQDAGEKAEKDDEGEQAEGNGQSETPQRDEDAADGDEKSEGESTQ